ncbi:MAG: uracil-DNA glycosylase [Desulfobacterium sp.]|nr:uracil-DNA glycosylase [Desulfobacterium sp.]
MAKHTPNSKSKTEINCISCKHFYITYNKHFPYGCRSAGFKSRLLPSIEMFTNSGIECQLFKEKERAQKT